jgi:hypothetical protein
MATGSAVQRSVVQVVLVALHTCGTQTSSWLLRATAAFSPEVGSKTLASASASTLRRVLSTEPALAATDFGAAAENAEALVANEAINRVAETNFIIVIYFVLIYTVEGIGSAPK